MSDTQKQLAEVQAAISTILAGGQQYKIGTRSLTRADLSKLYDMKKELEAAVAEENNGILGRRAAAVVFDRR